MKDLKSQARCLFTEGKTLQSMYPLDECIDKLHPFWCSWMHDALFIIHMANGDFSCYEDYMPDDVVLTAGAVIKVQRCLYDIVLGRLG